MLQKKQLRQQYHEAHPQQNLLLGRARAGGMNKRTMMIDTKPQNAMPPARLHAILARHGAYAVVFRRGPSDKVALIGWDRSNDTFTLGQWLRGRIYPLRCDLSPSGKHLIYFAAKYGRENPVEKRICEELKKRFKTVDIWRVDHRLLTQAEDELRRKKEFQKLEKSEDYHDCSWTAISRSPYLKALSIWYQGDWHAISSTIWKKNFCVEQKKVNGGVY